MLTDRKNSHRKVLVVYFIAALLMVVRVDYWWWGEEMPLILFGWISLPMLYQAGIWLAGYLLVIYVATKIWTDEE